MFMENLFYLNYTKPVIDLMGCGAAMVNKRDQSAHEIVLEMVVEAFGLLRGVRQYVGEPSKL